MPPEQNRLNLSHFQFISENVISSLLTLLFGDQTKPLQQTQAPDDL